jgi:hypothetical protein
LQLRGWGRRTFYTLHGQDRAGGPAAGSHDRSQRSRGPANPPFSEGLKMPDFMMETWFMILMGVCLVGLIILMVKLRNKRDED